MKRAILSVPILAVCLAAPSVAWGPISSMGPEIFAYFRVHGSPRRPDAPTLRSEGCFASQWSPVPALDWRDQLLLIRQDTVDPSQLALFIHWNQPDAIITEAGAGLSGIDQISLDVTSQLTPRRVTRTRIDGLQTRTDEDGVVTALQGTYQVLACDWSAPIDCTKATNYKVTARGGWSAERVPLGRCYDG